LFYFSMKGARGGPGVSMLAMRRPTFSTAKTWRVPHNPAYGGYFIFLEGDAKRRFRLPISDGRFPIWDIAAKRRNAAIGRSMEPTHCGCYWGNEWGELIFCRSDLRF
jgi:hypothetical protein